MNDLMNKNFFPNNIEEQSLSKRIEQMKNSRQIPIFTEKIKECVNDITNIFSYRIKESFSAIRTYRLAGYRNADRLHDLLGFLFVVNSIEEIPLIEKRLKEQIDVNNFKIYNLLEEKEFKVKKYSKIESSTIESEYNNLILNDMITWLKIEKNIDVLLPPFSYNVLCKKKFVDIEDEISIEFRIQTKEDFITTESYYYTIHKNDNIPVNIKVPLLCMCFRILRRKSCIAFLNNLDLKKKMELEINKIMKENKIFIEENKEIIDSALAENDKILDCWRSKYPIYGFHF